MWTPFNSPVFTQDKELVESAQHYYDEDGSAFERSVEADAAAITARKIVEMAASDGWRRKTGHISERRIVHVRI